LKADEDARPAKRIKDETEPYQTSRFMPHTTESELGVEPLCDLFPGTSTANHLAHPIANDSATADRILHKEVHNAKEALNLLYEAAAETTSSGEGQRPQSTLEPNDRSRVDETTKAWREFWCVKSGWISDAEARDYIDLYLCIVALMF